DAEPEGREVAAEALWLMTRQSDLVIPALREVLGDRSASSDARVAAARACRTMGKDCLPAWDELVWCATHDSLAYNVATRCLRHGGAKRVPVLLSRSRRSPAA